MKKICITLALVLALTLAACSANEEPKAIPEAQIQATPEAFSWSEVEACHKGSNDPGVRWNGFANVAESPITDAAAALERAQNEYRLQADESYTVSHDPASGMWKVYFFPKPRNDGSVVVGGDFQVYMSDKGITLLTVAGE